MHTGQGASTFRTGDPRTLLIGTQRSVVELAHALRLAEPNLNLVGAVVVDDVPPGQLHTDAEDAQAPACPGIEVLGTVDSLGKVAASHRVRRALIALPMDQADQTRRIGQVLDAAAVSWRFMPTLADQLAGRLGAALAAGEPASVAAAPRPRHGPADNAVIDPCHISPEQLLGRIPAALDEGLIRDTLAGRSVLITGAGGSIGSELVRIVGRFTPRCIVLMERSENALFEIDREAARAHPGVARIAVLHDVTNAARTLDVVRRLRPHIIFHAAAHKHVPMMEDHPADAVENNFYGTRSIADAADRAGVGRFVMISTDKAVNPTSVMGASKRLAELYVQHLNRGSQTIFSMVRFGNVLGSACSVLPIWARQLAAGEPITVTHRDMMRYFMTIPEAAGLVVQSATLARGGEVFLLDMGEPIRIVDMAERFIRGRGLEPGRDVSIVFTGVRPGEKLYEELAYDHEDMRPTRHAGVRIWNTTPPSPKRMQRIIAMFDRLRGREGYPWRDCSSAQVLAALRDAVPEMRPSAEQLLSRAAAG